MFEDESQAKEFARQKAAQGLLVNAGTLNPHLPKRAIAPGDIQRWIEEARSGSRAD
jgi:hydroxyethylthiazole kinase-like sugar kinase family protein